MQKNSKEGRARYNEKRAAKRAEERAEKDRIEKEAEEQAASKLEAHKRAMSWKNEKAKARAWAFIVYPESAPENWKEILQSTGLPIAISPLHDSDKDPTEENKKPHWHVIAQWGNTTTGKAVKRITDRINAPTPIPLNGVSGYYRYFTHKDNPEKFQYDEKEIQTINGFNITDLVEMKKSEVIMVKQKVQTFIIEHGITEYAVLMDYLLSEDLTIEYDVVSSHTYFFDKYISSRRNMLKEGNTQYNVPTNVDPKTGEVLS